MGSQPFYSIILFLYSSNAKIKFCFLQCLTLLTFFAPGEVYLYNSSFVKLIFFHFMFFYMTACFTCFLCLYSLLHHFSLFAICPLFLTTAKLGFLNTNWSNTQKHTLRDSCIFGEQKANVWPISWKGLHCILVSASPKHYWCSEKSHRYNFWPYFSHCVCISFDIWSKKPKYKVFINIYKTI